MHVIGMVEAINQRYLVDEKRVRLKELYRLATPTSGKSFSVLILKGLLFLYI